MRILEGLPVNAAHFGSGFVVEAALFVTDWAGAGLGQCVIVPLQNGQIIYCNLRILRTAQSEG